MKSLIDFEAHQPFAARFFTQALATGHMVNAYVMRGRDLATMYRMTLRLAQIMNCSNPPNATSACGQCQSCRWIEENAHPGVITVSNLTYLESVDPETGVSKSKRGTIQRSIVVGQLDNLLKELGLHSGGFHRVVILTGAQEIPASETEAMPFPPPRDWSAASGKALSLLSLDRKMFPDVLANKFLKTLEEPPRDVMFFLLTDAIDKLLETIVSRCQTVPFSTPPDFYRVPLPPEARYLFDQLVQDMHRGNYMHAMETVTTYASDTGVASTDLLSQFQQFLGEKLTESPMDPIRFQAIKRYIHQLEISKTMIQDKVKEEAALEDLFLALARR